MFLLSNWYTSVLPRTLVCGQIAFIIPEGPCAVEIITVNVCFLLEATGTVATPVYGLTTLSIMCFTSLQKWRQALLPTEIIAPFINFTFAETSQLERKVSLINFVIAINTVLEGLLFGHLIVCTCMLYRMTRCLAQNT